MDAVAVLAVRDGEEGAIGGEAGDVRCHLVRARDRQPIGAAGHLLGRPAVDRDVDRVSVAAIDPASPPPRPPRPWPPPPRPPDRDPLDRGCPVPPGEGLAQPPAGLVAGVLLPEDD